MRPGSMRRLLLLLPAVLVLSGVSTVSAETGAQATLTLPALYPIRMDLLSSLQPVATLRAPMVFLTQQPKLPLALTISWLLWEPLQVLPDGSLGPGPIEADIAPGGRLDRTVRAIA